MSASLSETGSVVAGTVLGERFVLKHTLGEGSMGVVWAAHDRLADRPAAVKVLRRQLVSSREYVGRFKREARAAARFRHDSAVRVLGTGETEDRLPYIAMELVEGRSLAEIVLADSPLDVGRACNLVHQLLRALGSAHRQGIVHRDMKPANIRVVTDADGVEHPKILDFGIAKFVRGDLGDVTGGFRTKTGVIIGTPKYMSPEQIRGEAVDGRADVYAVGVMLYEMLTGKAPFEADDVFGFVALHLKEQAAPMTKRFPELDLPPEVDEIVLRMLAKEPKDRPDDPATLADEIEKWAVADPRAGQKAVALRRGVVAAGLSGAVGAAAAWIVAPGLAPAPSAAALGLGAGAALAAHRFGRPSVFAYVKRVSLVLGVAALLALVSLAVPGSPGIFVTSGFALAALVVYAGFLLAWNAPTRWYRFLAAGVAAPALCALLVPVLVRQKDREPYYLSVYQSAEGASADAEGDAKRDAVLALGAMGLVFGLASVALPRPGAARR